MRRLALTALGPVLALTVAVPAFSAHPVPGLAGVHTGPSVSSGIHTSSAPSRARWPDPITAVTTAPGPQPGETTISWTTSGVRTSYFKVVTALTPFPLYGSTAGWQRHVFRADGHARSLTLTPDQTAAAGAGLGGGRHLFVRVYAVHSSQVAARVRGYAHIQSATIAGQPPATGTPIRVASYNVRLAQADVGTAHDWADRAPLIAANLARQHPAVVAVQELIPAMWTPLAGGSGLAGALGAAGLGRYQLTRTNGFTTNMVGDARILYDTTQLAEISTCGDARATCGIVTPDLDGRQSVAQYAEFRDLASGSRFWFVSMHFTNGNTVAGAALRTRQAAAVLQGLAGINTENLPVILGADANSYQTAPGGDAPQAALRAGGFYDTSAAVSQVNMQYNTQNKYAPSEVPSPNGFGARLDVVMTSGMPGSDRFEIVRTGDPYPSDHNMVVADLELPSS